MNMKKYMLLTAAALVLSLALTGCSGILSKTDGAQDSAQVSDSDKTGKTDKSDKKDKADKSDKSDKADKDNGGEEQYSDPEFTDIDETIDMDIVEGTDATTADDENAEGETAGAEVEITDAKVIDYSENKLIVVSFKFKNKSGSDMTFAGLLRASAYQNDGELPPAVVMNVEGIACETLSQVVKNGDTITVQKAFGLADTESPVTVSVEAAANPDPMVSIQKTFNIQ